MIRSVTSPRAVLAALGLSLLGLAAVDSRPAEAVVVCGAGGCVARRPAAALAYAAPVARVGVAGPVGVGRVGVGRVGAGRNLGGPVNRIGRR
jgi:hypothetical protein